MRFSVGLPTGMEGVMYPVPFANTSHLIEIARKAEAWGYQAVWGNDHFTTQRYVKEEFETPPNFWEVLITLAVVAAKTRHIQVGTGVLVPALRKDIVVLAKQLTTLDHFSQGRLLIGVGVGAYREEFEAVNPGRSFNRGKILDEFLEALSPLMNNRQASWDGEYYRYQDIEMFPKPFQKALPIYIGGNNENSLRRVARFAQGWFGAGMPPAQFREALDKLKKLMDLEGRDFEQLDIAPQLSVCLGPTHQQALSTFQASQMYRHLVSLSKTSLKDQVAQGYSFEEIDLIGTSQEVTDRIAILQDFGVTHIAGMLFTANCVEDYLEQMQQFAEEVIPFFNS